MQVDAKIINYRSVLFMLFERDTQTRIGWQKRHGEVLFFFTLGSEIFARYLYFFTGNHGIHVSGHHDVAMQVGHAIQS